MIVASALTGWTIQLIHGTLSFWIAARILPGVPVPLVPQPQDVPSVQGSFVREAVTATEAGSSRRRGSPRAAAKGKAACSPNRSRRQSSPKQRPGVACAVDRSRGRHDPGSRSGSPFESGSCSGSCSGSQSSFNCSSRSCSSSPGGPERDQVSLGRGRQVLHLPQLPRRRRNGLQASDPLAQDHLPRLLTERCAELHRLPLALQPHCHWLLCGVWPNPRCHGPLLRPVLAAPQGARPQVARARHKSFEEDGAHCRRSLASFIRDASSSADLRQLVSLRDQMKKTCEICVVVKVFCIAVKYPFWI